jgi:fibronectin-binding autotransporter adhesin
LVAGGAENGGTNGPLGVSNTISFTGGTLGFSVNNTFDYSPRFSTAASQAYSFDTGGQSVTFATGLSSSGGTLTKAGAGTLTLAGSNTYSGPTTVNAGELVFQGSMSGSGNITVADGAALGVTATGTPVAPGTLILGTSAGATLEFNNVNSTTTAPLAAGTLSSAGTLTINVNSGTLTVRRSYPLLTWTSGSAPTVALGTLSGCMGNLSISGNTLYLTITGTSYVWTGLNNGSWDLTTPNNWKQNGGPAIFTNGGPALFDDTAPGTTTVTINALVWPASVTVNNSILIYSITSSPGKDICGGTGLSKSGSATLTLSGGANTYTSVTTVSGGTLSVSALANGGSASDIGAPNNSASNLVLNGGALQYTGGGVSCDRLFTLGAGGGAIDASGSGALTLNNTGSVGFSGTGARTLTLTGADTDANTLAAALADHGGATSLTKNGAGTWVLTGTNTYSGVTTIASGTLQIGAGGASGAIGTNTITDNGSLIFDSSGTLTIGVVSGTGSVTQQGSGRVILPGNNTYSGGTAINAGTLQIGNGGATGSLYNNSPIVNNGTLIFNSTGSFTLAGYNAAISGTGQLIKQGSGLLQLLGAETYTGGTTIFPGAQLQVGSGNQGSIVGNITNNGSLLFVRQDNGFFVYSGNISGMGSVTKDVNNFNPGDVTLTGTNTYTGGTIIKGGAIILGDGVTPGAGSIVGNVLFTNSVTSFDVARTLIFNRPDNFTFSGLISGSGSTNAANMGAVLQEGFGTVTLTANNTYTGSTTVSNGTLVLVNGSVGGDLNVSGGTLLPGAVGSVGALDVGGNMSISSGTVVVTLNKALSPSNSMISVAGSITNSGGTLKLLNFGPNLVVGDHFAIFSQPVTGAAMTIVSPGFTVANHLAVNGSVTVSSVAPPGTGIITAPLSGGQLNLSWPASYTGLHLQMQTDPLTAGIGTNWVTIPGTDGGNSYSTAVSTNACVFYRLAP